MDISNGTAARILRHPKASSSERFLGAFPCSASAAAPADELNEDDVFWSGDFSEPTPTPTSTSPSSSPRHLHPNRPSLLHNHKPFAPQPESFGILAALPENEASSPNLRNHSHVYNKPSVSSSSSSSSSSSRLIPVIPKPPQDRINPPPSSSVKFHQSAPVNVPVLSAAMRRHHHFFLDVDDDDDGRGRPDAQMLPPHEIVARGSAAAHSPMLACSVLEGVGRTLKGRDLRQVRNAVWRQTGFLD